MAANVDKSFILSALRAGFTETQIAESLNVTASAVAQLINAYDLRTEAAKNSRFEGIDEKLNSIEEKVLDRLTKVLPTVTDPMKLTRMLQVVNSARRRSMANGDALPHEGNVKLVQLRLPERMQLEVVLSERNEVIGVNGRALVTASPSAVREAAARKPQLLDHQETEVSNGGNSERPLNVASLL